MSCSPCFLIVIALCLPRPSYFFIILPLSWCDMYTARFSPDDKFSKQRITLKKRFGLLPTQQPERTW